VAKPIELSGDVVTGASTLAGLFLVYLGNVATAYGTYDREAQSVVRHSFQRRARLAVIGIIFAILAAGLALLGKWDGSNGVAASAIVLLLAALVFGVVIGVVGAQDIR